MLSHIVSGIPIPSVNGVATPTPPAQTQALDPSNPFMVPALMGINGQNILEGAANRQVQQARQHVLGSLSAPAVAHPTMQSYNPSKGDLLAMALIGLAGNLSAPNSQVGTQAINTWMSLRDAKAQKEWQNAEILAKNREAAQQADLAKSQFEYNSAINQREDLQTQILRQDQRLDKVVKTKQERMQGLLNALNASRNSGLPGATGAAFDRALAFARANGLELESGLNPEMRSVLVRESAGVLFADRIQKQLDSRLKAAKATGELTEDGAKEINDWLDQQKKYYGIPDDYPIPYVEAFTTQARKAADLRQKQFEQKLGVTKQDQLHKWAYQDSRIDIMRSQLQINLQNMGTSWENAITNRDRANAYVLGKRLKGELDVNRAKYEKVLFSTRKILSKYKGFQSDADIDKALKQLEDNPSGLGKLAFDQMSKEAQNALMQYKWARDWLSDNPVTQDPEGDSVNTAPIGDITVNGTTLRDDGPPYPFGIGPIQGNPNIPNGMPSPVAGPSGQGVRTTKSGRKYRILP